MTDTSTDSDTALNGEAQHATGSLSLPPEIWQRIMDLLLPSVRAEHTVHSIEGFPVFNHRKQCIGTSYRDLLALSLSCKQLYPLATQALYRIVSLGTGRQVSRLARSVSEKNGGNNNDNDSGGEGYAPKSGQLAHRIRALHIRCELTSNTEGSPMRSTKVKRARASDVGVLLAHTDHVRYLSLDCVDGRKGRYDAGENAQDAEDHAEDFGSDELEIFYEDDADFYSDWYDDEGEHRDEHDEEQHPLIHLLSKKTTCRPRGLRYNIQEALPNAVLARATSFAPLSQLTHLELVRKLPPQDLIGFVLGAPHLATSQPNVVEAIAAGLSPHDKLECLRFSGGLGMPMVHDFAEYAAVRQQAGLQDWQFCHDAQHLELMYTLATHSTRLPKLRLVVLEVRAGVVEIPLELLKQLKRTRVLKKAYREFPPLADGSNKYGDSSLASVFSASIRDTVSGNCSLDAGSLQSGINAIDPYWQEHFREMDECWRKMHEGKHVLQRLWNDSRIRAGLLPTEIRLVVADRHWEESECQFRCQADGFDKMDRDAAPTTASADVGVWADPDVFSLVRTKPWLSYHQLPRYGCCSWSGMLPRDNNPNAIPPDAGGEARRIIVPPIVKLERVPREEESRERHTSEQVPSASNEQGGAQAALKRQRTESESATTQEAGPASI
ncbi:hypothetical protein EX895_003283 [Sporisorium graminicola]|uniref:Uncharacterized protein n=1 Tax=Sporisorium graminicola TaxID=280036 RepID=A0A4U7KXY7_9BASI|nr:hypothetical protein EX895_003283 [Sporisorium graminicola]TKY87702.1 hypothetical protein EX895_003283 [Sporisorium graminicola]